MHFDPRGFCGGAKRLDAVARAAVSADDALLLGFGEDVHHAFEALGPVAFGEAVHEANVDLIGAEFAAEAVQIGACRSGVARPGLGEHGDLVARDMLEGFGDVRMAAVGIGGIEEAQAAIVAIEQQIGQAFDAERGLMRMMAHTDSARAHGETAGLDAGLPESYRIGCGELARERGNREGAARERRGVEPSPSCGASSAMEKFAAFHGASWDGVSWLAGWLSIISTRGRDVRLSVAKGDGDASGLPGRAVQWEALSLLDNLPMGRVYMSNV